MEDVRFFFATSNIRMSCVIPLTDVCEFWVLLLMDATFFSNSAMVDCAWKMGLIIPTTFAHHSIEPHLVEDFGAVNPGPTVAFNQLHQVVIKLVNFLLHKFNDGVEL